MTMQPVKLPPGVFRSATPALSRGRYWDTNLVRWRSGALLPVGGWERISSAPLPGAARRLHCWRDLNDVERTVAAGDGGIYVVDGSTYVDRTPASFVVVPPASNIGGFGIGPYSDSTYGSPRAAVDVRLYNRPDYWSLDNFGGILLAVNSTNGALWSWNPSTLPLADKMAVQAGAPTSNRAMVVTEERHVMLFGAGGVPYRIAWCDQENLSDWDFASITNTAGFFDLSISGWIVTAIRVKGGVLVFTDSDVWLGTYQGPPYIYGFTKVGEHCSLFSPYSVATISTGAIWLGRQGFWIYEGGMVRPAKSDIGDYLFKQLDEVSASSRVHMASNGLFPEVWLFYPSTGQTECNRYAIWSWAEDWWALGGLPRSAMLAAGVSPYPVLAGVDGNLYQHERGWTAAGASRVGTVWAESGPLSVSNGERTWHCLGGQLDTGTGYGGSQLRVITSFTSDGPEYQEGPYRPRTDGWLDARFAARDARLRLESVEDVPWSVGEIRLDIVPGGRR